MNVDSYLELFTTLFGWAFYGVLWDVLVGTGIVYLPFLGILIDNWRDPAEGGEFGTVTALSLRRMEIELYLALLVVVLAAQPAAFTALDAGTLQYTPPPTLTEPNPVTATVTNSQSSFGATGFTGSPDTVNLPLWWYGVLAASSGINHAVIEGLPTASDLRSFEQQARLATIANPALRAETSQFYSDCFVPARSRFQKQSPISPVIDQLLGEYGPSDPDWMGSHLYQELNGFYDRYRATSPISGWAFNPARDTEYDTDNPPPSGRPTCLEWWRSDGNGLRSKLVAEADLTSGGLSGLIVAIAPSLAGERQLDAVVRAVLANAPASWSNNDLVSNNTATAGIVTDVERLVKGGLATGGVVAASATFAVTMTAVLQGLPMVQAVLLLGIYALLPLLVVLSRYSLSILMVGALAIFTVKFWTVLWYLALWVDQNLILSMYPDVNLFLQIFANPGEHDAKRMLLNMITTSLYIGLPLLWSAMMAWAGIHIGRSLATAASPLNRTAESAGQKGGQIGQAALMRFKK
jgi:TraG-like protein, N-terminal region